MLWNMEHCWGVELLLTLSFVVILLYDVVCNNPSDNSHGTKASKEDDVIIRDGKKIIARDDGQTRALTNPEIANLFTDKKKNTQWVKNRYKRRKKASR